jgi:hypothetical protein
MKPDQDATAVADVETPTETKTRVAINGLGRIGRTFLKLAVLRDELDVVAINDIGDTENLAYLLRFDSVYGRFPQSVAIEHQDGTEWLCLGARRIRLLHEREPRRLPWRALQIDVVVEATGAFETYASARDHIAAGAAHVVLSAPAKDEDTSDARTVLVGVNTSVLKTVAISSNGSCTTNSASPVMQVLHDHLGVQKALLNTVHGYTATQRLVDSPGGRGDFRRGPCGCSEHRSLYDRGGDCRDTRDSGAQRSFRWSRPQSARPGGIVVGDRLREHTPDHGGRDQHTARNGRAGPPVAVSAGRDSSADRQHRHRRRAVRCHR